MNRFWRIRNGISRIRLAITRFSHLVIQDVEEIFPKSTARAIRKVYFLFNYKNHEKSYLTTLIGREPPDGSKPVKPVIFVSACVDAETPGGWKYNGGIKMLNLLVKLLRKHGYEAYMVTYDGKYEPWLIEHQPHISIQEFRAKLKSTKNFRCVTSWAISRAFIKECKRLYFWDMELKYTDNEHFSIVHKLLTEKNLKIAGCNSMICAWHMANWDLPCTLLIDWVDEEIWFPQKEKLRTYKVGYMLESESTEQEIQVIRDIISNAGLDLEFQLIRGGTEHDCLETMRSCYVFLGMNHGKDPLWGEGFGLPMMEAMSAGCVVIAYDVLGNREFIHSGFNGILVPRAQPPLMARALLNLYKKPGELERIREDALKMLRLCHTSEARWPAVREFLSLGEDNTIY